MSRPIRLRRSCLTVPASSPRMLAKAPGLSADEVVLDLEDSVAPSAKVIARRNIQATLNPDVLPAEGAAWADKTVAIRVSAWSTPWTYLDLIDVLSIAGGSVDCVILPKVEDPTEVSALDLLLTQIEQTNGLETGRIGIEAQIESAAGVVTVEAIARSSARLEALIFGPLDYSASIGVTPSVPSSAYPRARMLNAAKAHGLQAIDGPFVNIDDTDGLRDKASETAALGYDGMWVIHPSQIEAANQGFCPSQDDFNHAEHLLDTYVRAQDGATTMHGEMIDEASRRVAQVIVVKGRAAGLTGTQPSSD